MQARHELELQNYAVAAAKGRRSFPCPQLDSTLEGFSLVFPSAVRAVTQSGRDRQAELGSRLPITDVFVSRPRRASQDGSSAGGKPLPVPKDRPKLSEST